MRKGIADGFVGIFRASIVLKHYRGFTMPDGEKFTAWTQRLFEHPVFKSTCSTEDLYLESYERSVFLTTYVGRERLTQLSSDTPTTARTQVW